MFVFCSLVLLASIRTIAQVPANSGLGHIYGSIVNGQGQPVALATLEVRDLHGIKISSSVSDAAGNFVFAPIGKFGDYVFLAANEVCVSEERITLDTEGREFNVTLPDPSERFTFMHRETDTVSARQLRVPKEARKYLRLANQEFNRLHLENAEADVDQQFS